jgi:hypothetical protein
MEYLMTNDAVTEDADDRSGILRFEEQDESGERTGRSATFAGVEFQPLGYSDLVSRKLRDKVKVPLRWQDARVLESTLPEITLGQAASVSTSLESHFSTQAIGLVKGGWLPSGLALQAGMVVFPDRCTVKDLAARFSDGVKTGKDDMDFLDFFQGKPVRINPSLFAMEGNNRQRPTPQQVQDQWEEACRKIKTALPLAELTPDGAIQGIIGLLDDLGEGMERKKVFLLSVMHIIKSPISISNRTSTWRKVLEIARDCGVLTQSLVVIAVLSVVCVANGAGPAKRLLKPSSDYSAQDAYNALADLQSLEMLMRLYATYPQEKIMLCTGDKNLALFWSGIRASNFISIGHQTSFTISPVEALLPNVSSDLLAAYLNA